jgi:nucleoside-diphosphate-sugar epimerase
MKIEGFRSVGAQSVSPKCPIVFSGRREEMMRILVLGGTRFIGPPAVRRLAALGHEVTVFHRGQSQADLSAAVHHLTGDRKEWATHAATLRALAPELVLDMMLLGEADAQQVVETFRGVARRLVAISSVDVYRAYDRFRGADPGPPDPTPLTEDSPLRGQLYPYRAMVSGPEDRMYHYDKILMERVVLGEPTLPGTVLRLPMVYGPGDYQHRLFEYVKRMDDGRPAILLESGFAGWRAPRGYVEDLGAAIASAVIDDRAAGRIYHVGDTLNRTEAEWVRQIGDVIGWRGEIVTLPNERLPASLHHQYDPAQDLALDTTRIRQELGYKEHTPPDEALRRTIAWERANPPQQLNAAQFDYTAEDAVLKEIGVG